MNTFTVSVIIPNYNNASFLRQCIDSVLNQTYPIHEIIIFDDCSTDDSHIILKEYEKKHSNIKVIYSKVNCGVSKARHTAIELATSGYISTLDADDYYYSNRKIEKEMKVIQKNSISSKRYVVGFTQRVDIDIDGNPMGDLKLVKKYPNIRFGIVTRTLHQYMPRDICLPRELYFKTGGYNFERKLFEDWELGLKYLKYADFIYAHEFGTAYRHKDGGLSDVNIRKIYLGKKVVYDEQKDELPYKLIEKIVFNLVAYATYCVRKMLILFKSITKKRS